MGNAHLYSAARCLERILTARDPSRVWKAEVITDPDDTDTTLNRDQPPAAGSLHNDRGEQAA